MVHTTKKKTFGFSLSNGLFLLFRFIIKFYEINFIRKKFLFFFFSLSRRRVRDFHILPFILLSVVWSEISCIMSSFPKQDTLFYAKKCILILLNVRKIALTAELCSNILHTCKFRARSCKFIIFRVNSVFSSCLFRYFVTYDAWCMDNIQSKARKDKNMVGLVFQPIWLNFNL